MKKKKKSVSQLKFKPFERIELVWDDAASNTSTWLDTNKLSSWIEDRGYIKSIGYHVRAKPYDKAFMTICLGYSCNQAKEICSITNAFKIPRGCIRSIRKLRP